MKAFHISDIHFRGLSRHAEYKQCFEQLFKIARKEKPDLFFLGGDIVHSKTQGITPELIDILTWCFETMAEIAPVHMILGNHDGLILNKSRQDAITPIVNALDNDKIHLYKKSGTYSTGIPGFNWCVFSCFDEEGWNDVKPVKGDINIACFHGAVRGSSTDTDWKIEGEITTDFFDDYDYVFLGDIHKRQNVSGNGVIAYPGSFIQQDYGEDPMKGCLLWDIQSSTRYDVKFVHIANPSPFITIGYRGDIAETNALIDSMPSGARVRIASDVPVPPVTLNLIESRLHNEKSPREIVYKITELAGKSGQAVENAKTGLDLRRPDTMKSLVRDFYVEHDLNDVKLTRLDGVVDRYLQSLEKQTGEDRSYNWSLDKLTFSNTFAFRGDNEINFEKLNGITGIFGKNRAGKSSIIGSLVYCLFNTSDRGSLKNLHIINDKEDSCQAEAQITVKGEKYKIDRRTKKSVNKKGDVNVNTTLGITKIDADLQLSDVSDEQRRETDKILRQLIGTSDDFFMTSLAAQGNLNKFFDEKSTARKQILGKFLNLDIFDALYEKSREDLVPLRATFRGRRDQQQIDTKIKDVSGQLDLERKKTSVINECFSESSKKLDSLRQVVTGNSSLEAAVVLRDLERKKAILLDKKENQQEQVNLLVENKKKYDDKVTKVEKLKIQFPIDVLKSDLARQSALQTQIDIIKSEIQQADKIVSRLKDDIGILNTVPCGDDFPTCPFIKKAFTSKSKIVEEEAILTSKKKDLKSVKDEYDILAQKDLFNKIKKYESLLDEERSCNLESSKIDMKVESLKNSIDDLDEQAKQIDVEMRDLEKVVNNSSNLCGVYDSIKELENEIDSLRKDQLNNAKNIGSYESTIETLTNEKMALEKDLDDLEIYELINMAMSKKGLPSQIISKMLPQINNEIQNILMGVCNFTVELEVDDESNSLEIYINYGDKRRIIELGSGMEKMISAIATRVALINLSSLPKSNIFIIDEGFGALDDTNLEACTRLLRSLKKYFRQILIISHVDAIKDAVDNFVDINWIDGGASVRHV